MPTVPQGISVSDNSGDEVQPVSEVHSVCLSDLTASSEYPGDGPDDAAPADSVEELRQRLRALCKKNLYFLCKAILGYADMTMHTHWKFSKFIQDLDNKRTVDLLPRGCFKTSIGTIGFAIWLLINNPNLFILIANQTAGNAQTMLEEIEAHLDGTNPLMAWLFPEMIKPGPRWKPWSSNRMTVPNRTVVSGTASVSTIGVGGKPESKHHHVIIKDDLIGRKAMMSQLEMMEAIAWNDYSESLFVDSGKGIERMHGTRWSLSDLYNIILEDPKYETFIRQAVDPHGELFFPERLSHETLRRIRENNYFVFMSQYQNDPSSPENLDFNKAWLRKYLMRRQENDRELYCEMDGRKFWVKDMEVGMLIDPASSGDVEFDIARALARGRAHKANNCIMIVGAHPSGYWFILDVWTGRGKGENPELQIAKKMFEMALRWKGYVYRGFLECYGAEGGLLTVYNMLCDERNYHLTIEKIPRGVQKSKLVRIRGNIGTIAGNQQLCCRDIHDQFILEFSQFPQSYTFDTLDALSWAIVCIRHPPTEVQVAAVQESTAKHKRMRLRYIGSSGY